MVGLFKTYVTGAALSLLADSIAQLLELRRPELRRRGGTLHAQAGPCGGLLMLIIAHPVVSPLAEWFPRQTQTSVNWLPRYCEPGHAEPRSTRDFALAVFTRSPPSANKCALLLHKLRTALPA